MEHAYCWAAGHLLAEWRAGRATSAQTWTALRSLRRPPAELRARHWRRVLARATMRALHWLLRAVQPLERWRPWQTPAHTAAAREAVLARLGAYLTNLWYALKRVDRGVVPEDLQRAEQTLLATFAGFDVLRELPAPRLPPEAPGLNEP